SLPDRRRTKDEGRTPELQTFVFRRRSFVPSTLLGQTTSALSARALGDGQSAEGVPMPYCLSPITYHLAWNCTRPLDCAALRCRHRAERQRRDPRAAGARQSVCSTTRRGR